MSDTGALAGRIGLGLALADLGFVALLWAVGDGMGVFAPMIPPYTFVYWGAAIAAIGCAVMTMRARHWLLGLSPLVILAATLVPSGMLAYECSTGNCL